MFWNWAWALKLLKSLVGRMDLEPMVETHLGLRLGFFSFLYLKKIKISKIYGGFEKFQNYTPVAPCLGDRGSVAPWLSDRT